jgi:hypothetical protein
VYKLLYYLGDQKKPKGITKGKEKVIFNKIYKKNHLMIFFEIKSYFCKLPKYMEVNYKLLTFIIYENLSLKRLIFH